MTIRNGHQVARSYACPVAWVVPGPLRQLTGGYLYDARIVDGLRARRWQVGVVDVRSTRWPLDPAAGRRLVSALGSQRWGGVVVDELAHPALAAALLGARLHRALAGAPLILLVHHLRCSEPAPCWQQTAARLVERLVLRSADLVICTSRTTARTTRPLVARGTSVEVVRPGWDTHGPVPRPPVPSPRRRKEGADRQAPGNLPLSIALRRASGEWPREHRPAEDVAADVRATQRSWGGAHPPLRLLLVGHWTPRKGILDALAAVARLGPGVTLDLVGEQDRDPHYASRVWAALEDPILAERARVHGRVSADALIGLYARSDALVLPSTYEGYGMVLAEALAAGLPIVATRVGAVPEIVRDGSEADLVPPGDVGALARAIERLAADPAERERRAALARERAQTLPRWADGVAAFEGHLHSALARTLSGA